MNSSKKEILSRTIEHIDITKQNVVPVVDAMAHMAFTARDLHRAADIYNRMVADKDCGIILCLAGSLISAGLKKVFVDMIRNNMVDAIVSTGANMIDQDFFEALGYKHYLADDRYKSGMFDGELRELMIDRIYDTFIDEEELRVCDETTQKIFDELEPRPYSRANCSANSAFTSSATAAPSVPTASSGKPTSATSPSLFRLSAIARRDSASWRINTTASRKAAPPSASTAARIFWN